MTKDVDEKGKGHIESTLLDLDCGTIRVLDAGSNKQVLVDQFQSMGNRRDLNQSITSEFDTVINNDKQSFLQSEFMSTSSYQHDGKLSMTASSKWNREVSCSNDLIMSTSSCQQDGKLSSTNGSADLCETLKGSSAERDDHNEAPTTLQFTSTALHSDEKGSHTYVIASLATEGDVSEGSSARETDPFQALEVWRGAVILFD